MIFLVFIGLFFILGVFPYFRYALFHPVKTIPQFFRDFYKKVKFKENNKCPYYGKIFTFTASDSQAFGSGKTLSMVRWVRDVYRRYNGLRVWDGEKFVEQKIIIVSNLRFHDIPYIPFIGKDQFVNIDQIEHTENDVIIFVVDEAGMEFNSRKYKENLPTDFLVRLLQVRHNKITLCMTSQRFGFIDKVLRNTCEVVTTCKKKWRIVRLQDYDAYALENCSNPEIIRPISTRFYFASDKLFNAYDTTYNVTKLKEELQTGQLLTTPEILSITGDSSSPDNAKSFFRRKFRKE